MVKPEAMRGIRIQKLRLGGLAGRARSYSVDFTIDAPPEQWRPLSIIAGPSQTGKTSVVEFLLYCLGDSDHPQHPEILERVRAAIAEVSLAGTVHTIERSATGPPSRFASVWTAPFVELETASEMRLAVEPTSDPAGLSQYILASCDLHGISLPEAPTQRESAMQTLSIRDLSRLVWLPNERLDNKNLTFEQSNYMVAQKFRQTVEAIFEVQDLAAAERAVRLRVLSESARAAREKADSLKGLVQEEYPGGVLVLESAAQDAEQEASRLAAQIARVDEQNTSHERYAVDLREALRRAQVTAQDASLRVRHRESLLHRLAALRGQYADDKKKLTFLKEAERLFDPLRVHVCPACLSSLDESPEIVDGCCTMCGKEVAGLAHLHDVPYVYDSDRDGTSDDAEARGMATLEGSSNRLLEAELRATSLRLNDLNDYWTRLNSDLQRLRQLRDDANREVGQTEEALNSVITLPAPFLAARDELKRRATNAQLSLQSAQAGLRLWQRVEQLETAAERLEAQVRVLRSEERDATTRPDRTAVISKLSRRFGKILSDFGYPKLSAPLIDGKLIPHVRDLPYTSASSGGRVLLSLAYYLALWEVSYEEAPRAPGLLIVDSPQKNLGHGASGDDPDFADTRLVENFYTHVQEWLSGDGRGAQLIVIDNSPPDSVANDVVVRFTRDSNDPPYGLIDDAVD